MTSTPTRRGSAPAGRPESSTLPSAAVKANGTSLDAEEATIRRSLGEAAAALTRIRDGRLYVEANYCTFDDYCTNRLGFGRGRADQIIGAGRVVAALPTNVGGSLNEGQVRALGPYRDHPDLAAEVLAVVAAQGKVTAAAISAEVGRRRQDAQDLTDQIAGSFASLDVLVGELRTRGRGAEAGVLADGIDRMLACQEPLEDVMEEVGYLLEAMEPAK